MAKYHINPKTGDSGVCNPEKTGICKYSENGKAPEHYDSPQKAEKAYAKLMEKELFKRLDKTIRTKQGEWFDNLDEDELNALSYYGKPYFHNKFNERMRAGESTAEDLEYIKNLDSALGKAPIGDEEKVYRGLNLSEQELTDILTNKQILNKGYTSVSLKLKMAEIFATPRNNNDLPVVLVFSTNKQSFLDTGEREVLLPRNTKLKVLNYRFDKESEKHVIDCEII